MGEIADDMVEGICCALCGQYFSEDGESLYEHGYPVACKDCYEPGCGYEEAEVDTL